MPRQLAPETTCRTLERSDRELEFVEREVDMGFFDQHHFEVKDGVVVNDSCQRVKKCSCNCHDCGWGLN